MYSKILSICIPTYNRTICLKECLDSVLASVAGHENDIEIVISDNASTDGTQGVVKAFQGKYPWIRYHRNELNIGGERNFRFVATLAQGQNIWIFGDDDKLEVNAIIRVLESIRAGNSLTICNYSLWNKTLSTKIKEHGLKGFEDCAMNDHNQILARFGLHLGYISSVVIRKDLFFKLPDDEYKKYIEYGFPFMYAVYNGIVESNCKANFIASILVRNRGGNSHGYDWYKYFATGSSRIFDELINRGYSKRAVSTAKYRVLSDFVLPRLVGDKLNGNIDNDVVWNLILTYNRHFKFWFGCIPIIYLPKYIINMLRRIYRMSRPLYIKYRH